MIQCMCVIQEGQAADSMRPQLAEAMEAFGQKHLQAPVRLNWLSVPPGAGFTAGEPSTASVVSLTAPAPLEQSQREALLRQLVALWTDQTGCSIDDVVAVVADPATH